MDNNKTYQMEFIGRCDELADACCQQMGWNSHIEFQSDTGCALWGLWFPTSLAEHAPVTCGMEIKISVVCVVDNRVYDGDCIAHVTSHGVYVNIDDYVNATT